MKTLSLQNQQVGMMSTRAKRARSEDIYIDRQTGRQAGRQTGRQAGRQDGKSTELGEGHDIGWRTWGGGSFFLFCPQHQKHQDIAELRIVATHAKSVLGMR